ncbi:MAG: hypothetical protein ACOYM2_09705 [Rectinemataceae bacterium]
MSDDSASPPPWTLIRGASWIALDGQVYPVPGFHEAWLAEHAELAHGARNVCELVLATRWVSATLFGEGYLELMVHDRHDPELRSRLLRLLTRAMGRWRKALVMAMDEEGYAMLEPADVDDAAALGRALDRGL